MEKQALKKLIKETLSKPKDSCNCGCNTCENVGNPGVLLNEGISKKYLISENIQFHVDNKIPLTENTFRYGSDSFLKLWNEARYLYLREAIYVNDDDKEILEETDLGNYGIYEGEKVPLDMPMEQEETINFDIKDINGVKTILATFGNNKIGALRLKPYNDSYQVNDVLVYPEYRGYDIGKEMYRLANDKLGPLYSDANQTEEAKYLWQSLIKSQEATYLPDEKRYLMKKSLNEAKYKGKKVALNKPKRGGSKAYYVYVRDPKTKKIKKVSFGSGGLRAKLDNPKARKAFAARHKCGTGEPKTSARYWSCRIGRYWKQLGGSKNFSGFW